MTDQVISSLTDKLKFSEVDLAFRPMYNRWEDQMVVTLFIVVCKIQKQVCANDLMLSVCLSLTKLRAGRRQKLIASKRQAKAAIVKPESKSPIPCPNRPKS